MKLDRKSYFSFSLIFVVAVQYAYCATVADEMKPISGSKEKTCYCGKANRRTRIIGGQETEVNEYPWMVEIMTIKELGQLCGGTIIDRSHVVSAAHCFKGLKASDLIVYVGDHQIDITTETANQSVLVSKLTIHEKFNPTTVANDIAVLKLATPLVYTRTILPACLPPLKFSMQSQLITVTGYGATEQGGAHSKVLNEAEIPTVSNSECKNKYSKSKPPLAVIDDSVFCAGYVDGRKDSCQGDSGSPAVVMCNNIYTFSGVVSYGAGCGNKDYPGVLTNISHYRNWIVTNAPGASLCEHDCIPKPYIPPVECGVANTARRRKRVVGGTTTTANQFPWMGAIFVKMANSYNYTCGATVLSNDWIVTSAKLINGIDKSRFLVALGIYNINIQDKTKEQDFLVSQVVIHPKYDARYHLNDIALLKLDGPAVYSQWVAPICLSSSMNKDFNVTNLNMLGWGRTSTNGSYADKLKSVVLKTMSNSYCRTFPGGYYSAVHPSTVCTTSRKDSDVCEGDSGGPLMTVGSSSGKYFLAAIQSFYYGGKCGSGYPSGNTRVPYYMDWITRTTGVTTYDNSNDAYFT